MENIYHTMKTGTYKPKGTILMEIIQAYGTITV